MFCIARQRGFRAPNRSNSSLVRRSPRYEPLEPRLMLDAVSGYEWGDLELDGAGAMQQVELAEAHSEPVVDAPLPLATRHLVHDCEAKFDSFGNEFYADAFTIVEPADGAASTSSVEGGPVPLTETFLLHSNPGANHTIYLDFDGHVTSGTIWNSSFNGGQDIVTPAYDFDGNVSVLSDAEMERIQYIWQRVAEDYLPFDVDVTTEDPGTAALLKSGGGDAEWGARVVIGGSGNDWYGSSVGGVAYRNSFNYSTDTPAFVFEAQLGNGAEKYTAESISHESGHTLGLAHDGAGGTTYYQGHGSGATGWAPIMGNSLYKNLTQWSSGEYSGATNTQDDLAIITSNNGFGYRVDDYGDVSGDASLLAFSGSSVSASGIIEQNSDIDVFSFTTDGGSIDLSIDPDARSTNLDILAELYDTASNLVFASSPLNILSASINTVVSAGTYFVHVSGVGQGDPAGTGYSDYGSLGQYSISGTVAPPSGEFLSLAATSADHLEGDAGSTPFSFTLTRSGNTGASTTVDYSVSGSGADPADAADFAGGVLPGGTVTFAAGEVSKTITVNVAGDTQIEADESFTVQLSNPSGVAEITAGSATGTILTDDVEPPSIDLDRFESNDTWLTATDLGRLNNRLESGLTLHSATDVDLFRFSARKTGTCRITTNFTSASSYAITAYDADMNVLAQSTGSSVEVSLAGGAEAFVEIQSLAAETDAYDLVFEKVSSIGGSGGVSNGGQGKGRGKPDKLQPDLYLATAADEAAYSSRLGAAVSAAAWSAIEANREGARSAQQRRSGGHLGLTFAAESDPTPWGETPRVADSAWGPVASGLGSGAASGLSGASGSMQASEHRDETAHSWRDAFEVAFGAEAADKGAADQ